MSQPGRKRILVVGLGSLGSLVVDLLTRTKDIEIVVACRNTEAVQQRVNLSTLAAYQLGSNARTRVIELDLRNQSQIEEVIAEVKPDIVFSAVTIQSWWVPHELPPAILLRLSEAGIGPWLPMHLGLIYNLMRGIRASGCNPIVVNASYPDVVNVVLDRVGLAPLVGIGNVANPVPALRAAVAGQRRCDVSTIAVRLVAHHYVSHRLSATGIADADCCDFSAFQNETEITGDIDTAAIFSAVANDWKRPGGRNGMAITAASAMTILKVLMSGSSELVHAPGPGGLPGGYPLILKDGHFVPDLPSRLPVLRAIQINEAGQVLDGVSAIDNQGTTTFTETAQAIMRELLGYECTQLRVEEANDRALELKERYLAFASNFCS
jgi:hypothetical protein